MINMRNRARNNIAIAKMLDNIGQVLCARTEIYGHAQEDNELLALVEKVLNKAYKVSLEDLKGKAISLDEANEIEAMFVPCKWENEEE